MFTDSPLSIKALETLVNQTINRDKQLKNDLTRLNKKTIAWFWPAVGITYYFTIENKAITVALDVGHEPDVTINANVRALLLYVKNPAQKNNINITLTGNNNDIEILYELIQKFHLDWQTPVSHVIGESLTYQLEKTVSKIKSLGETNIDLAAHSLGEFVQTDMQVITSGEQINLFCDEVDTIREKSELLEARLRRLSEKLDNEN